MTSYAETTLGCMDNRFSCVMSGAPCSGYGCSAAASVPSSSRRIRRNVKRRIAGYCSLVVAILAGNTFLQHKQYKHIILALMLQQLLIWVAMALLLIVVKVHPVAFVLGASLLPLSIVLTLAWYSLNSRKKPIVREEQQQQHIMPMFCPGTGHGCGNTCHHRPPAPAVTHTPRHARRPWLTHNSPGIPAPAVTHNSPGTRRPRSRILPPALRRPW